MGTPDQSFAPPNGVAVSPAPTDDEAIAIVAAMEALWPKPVVVAPTAPARRTTSWRFSGRWWTTPIPRRRARP